MQGLSSRKIRKIIICGAPDSLARPAFVKTTARQEFGGGIPKVGPAVARRCGVKFSRYGVNLDSINPSDFTAGQGFGSGQSANL